MHRSPAKSSIWKNWLGQAEQQEQHMFLLYCTSYCPAELELGLSFAIFFKGYELSSNLPCIAVLYQSPLILVLPKSYWHRNHFYIIPCNLLNPGWEPKQTQQKCSMRHKVALFWEKLHFWPQDGDVNAVGKLCKFCNYRWKIVSHFWFPPLGETWGLAELQKQGEVWQNTSSRDYKFTHFTAGGYFSKTQISS